MAICRPCGRDVLTPVKVAMGRGTDLLICADCRDAIRRRELGLSWADRGLSQTTGLVQCYGKTVGREGAWTC
jgi:hypothetical protein